MNQANDCTFISSKRMKTMKKRCKWVTKLSSNEIYAFMPPEVRGNVFSPKFNNQKVILKISYPS